MNEKEDVEEYRKRIRDLVERVENTKDKNSKYTEQDLIERKEKLLQTITRITKESKFRSERIIATLTYWINSIHKYKAENDHIPIDTLYKLIYEQLKKSNLFIPKLNIKGDNQLEIADKRSILRNMEVILGVERVNQFKKKYNINRKLLGDLSLSHEIFILCIIVLVSIVVAAYFIFFR